MYDCDVKCRTYILKGILYAKKNNNIIDSSLLFLINLIKGNENDMIGFYVCYLLLDSWYLVFRLTAFEWTMPSKVKHKIFRRANLHSFA